MSKLTILFNGMCLNLICLTSTLFAQIDTDGDSILDKVDIDDDNDGMPDFDEAPQGLTVDPSADDDNDGVPLYRDFDQIMLLPELGFMHIDADDNGTDDRFDNDGDGVPDHVDLDSDNDGIFDVNEAFNTSLVQGTDIDVNNDGQIDGDDADLDGLRDPVDGDSGGVVSPQNDWDEDGIPDYLDLDTDNDGVPDVMEAGYTDVNGDGILDIPDANGDGVDYEDMRAADMLVSGFLRDGILIHPGEGLNDDLSEGPVVAFDRHDPINSDALEDTVFTDSSPDYRDVDADGDGLSDTQEAFDFNRDGTPNVLASGVDANMNGWDDAYEAAGTGISSNLDIDEDGYLSFQDLDSDGDGINDFIEASDADGDYRSDREPRSVDQNGNGLDDAFDPEQNGVPIVLVDSDGNGIADAYENDVTIEVLGGALSGCSASHAKVDSQSPALFYGALLLLTALILFKERYSKKA